MRSAEYQFISGCVTSLIVKFSRLIQYDVKNTAKSARSADISSQIF